VYFCAKTEIRPTDVSINCDCTIAVALCDADKFSRSKVFEAISEDIWVGISKHERTKLHDADKPGEVQHFSVRVPTIKYAR
jgi:hypothetical protein